MSTDLIYWLKVTARFTASLHCGSYLYTFAVQHPSILAMKSPTDSIQNFKKVFKATNQLQIPIKIISISCCVLICYLSRQYEKNYLYAALILGTLTPYSHLLMSPFSKRVLDADLKYDEEKTKMLLMKKWMFLHSGRLIISLVANYFLQII